MSDKTPSPQSVVVPREALELFDRTMRDADVSFYHAARQTMHELLSAAPAPSSLAGGEVRRGNTLASNLARLNEMKDRIEAGGRATYGDLLAVSFVTSRLEGRKVVPARSVGVTDANGFRISQFGCSAKKMANDQGLNDQDAMDAAYAAMVERAALSPEAPARVVGSIAHVSHGRSELSAQITAALTPRHEASACEMCNGRGEVGGPTGQTPESFEYVTECCPDCGGTGKHEAPAEGAGEQSGGQIAFDAWNGRDGDPYWFLESDAWRQRWERVAVALRARSSAPEARS